MADRREQVLLDQVIDRDRALMLDVVAGAAIDASSRVTATRRALVQPDRGQSSPARSPHGMRGRVGPALRFAPCGLPTKVVHESSPVEP